MESPTFWLVVGFVGQALFTMRFLIQWLQSERLQQSIVPTAFWYFSLAGGLTLLAYSIHRRDPVFITGQAAGTFIYLRNLYFIRKGKSAKTTAMTPPAPPESTP
jgi:lipid-A-disaccharide synthase-like uncharacterized protein